MDTETVGLGGCEKQKRDRRITMLLEHDLSRSLSFFPSSFFFFLVTYCRVECNFLTLKISGWGAPTFRRQTGCRSRRERSEGWMMRKMKEWERKRERQRKRERESMHSCVGRANESEKKSRGLKGRITSGILVFAFHLDEKPISRFSVFPARTGTRIRCLLCEYRVRGAREVGPTSSSSPSPPSLLPEFVTSHIKSRSTL